MASLSEVYEQKRGGGSHVTPRQVQAGLGLFAVGAILVIVGLVVASTELLATWGIGRYESRRIAGLLGGIGVPAVFVGILTVLPASRRTRGAAAIGAAIALCGVALFWTVYPGQWLGAGVARHYTFETTAIYFLGTIITFWCFFVAAANFKTRNDPGGTVKLEVLTQGETKVVEVDKSAIASGLGSVGMVGSDQPTASLNPVSDGGSTTSGGSAATTKRTKPAAEPPSIGQTPTIASGDRYCGNCRHFEYVDEQNGLHPYCGYRGELMDNVQPCEEWSPHRNHATQPSS